MNIQNGVICGLSDWLYLQGGSNSLMEYHTGAKQLSEEEIESWRKTLQYRHEWHEDKNIKYLHVVAPNKICVYPEFYPEQLTIVGDRPIIQLLKNCGHLFTYQLDYLLLKKTQYDLYHKTDTHWNKIGAFFAAEQIINLLSYKYKLNQKYLKMEMENLKFFQKEITGDLGKKFSPPKSYVAEMVAFKSSRVQKVFDNGICNRGKINKFKNDSNEFLSRKLLVFGDSFTSNLIKFLAESFRETIFVHAAFVDFDYVEIEKPDIVISHMIERFIIQVPDDIHSPKVNEYAKFLGKII